MDTNMNLFFQMNEARGHKMRLYQKMICVFSFYLCCSGIVYADNAFKSEWDTDFKRLKIVQQGNQVSGSYDYAGGKITGTIVGNTIQGWWSETDDKHMCGPGNQWSGPFVMRLSSDGRSFKGNYGKCERGENSFDNLPSDRHWNGTLKKGKINFGNLSEWDTDFKRLKIVQQGNQVSGSYDYAGGKITGTIVGNTIQGWWSETDDKHMCGPGNQWSGPFVMRFSSDGQSFKGNYGKCERGENTFGNLPSDRHWNGTLKKGGINF